MVTMSKEHCVSFDAYLAVCLNYQVYGNYKAQCTECRANLSVAEEKSGQHT